MAKEEILKGLADAVVDMEEDAAVAYAERAVAEGVDAYTAIDEGLAAGMQKAGDLFEEEEYFIPELLLCSDAMNAGMDVLKPHLVVDEAAGAKIKIVIGVIEGDTHDIGKNLVKTLVEAGGFDVIDLGRDVKPQIFADTAIAENADVIALSTLMTTTMLGMPKVVDILRERGKKDAIKVIVGGGPLSQSYADKIGADGYAPSASEALKLLKKMYA
ncbi:MAG: corrinoid protein [Clostridiales Family XIII bacterium]|nr:corrinoid protein [Clostridiales Family XIII bacterium]